MSGSVSCFCCQLIVDNSCNFTIGDYSHDRPVSAMKNSQQVEKFPGQSLTLMEIYEDCMGALIIHSHPDLIFKICNISWNCDCPKRHRILLKLWHKYFFFRPNFNRIVDGQYCNLLPNNMVWTILVLKEKRTYAFSSGINF